jgi:uncharacterized protein YecT (DUF1311 family)
MKGNLRSSLFLVALVAAGTACSKSSNKTEVAQVAQDTMLMHDLAEANRNTAMADADTTTPVVLSSGGGAGQGALVSGPSPSNSPSQPTTAVRPATAPRMQAPTRANDAPAPTNVSARMPAGGDSETSRPSSGDPCDNPSSAAQRACLNHAIVVNDADLNSTYQALIAQSRKSGGAELEERFRQTQREWVVRRDVACRDQGTGELWARERARCLARHSESRTAELRQSLNGLRGQQ